MGRIATYVGMTILTIATLVSTVSCSKKSLDELKRTTPYGTVYLHFETSNGTKDIHFPSEREYQQFRQITSDIKTEEGLLWAAFSVDTPEKDSPQDEIGLIVDAELEKAKYRGFYDPGMIGPYNLDARTHYAEAQVEGYWREYNGQEAAKYRITLPGDIVGKRDKFIDIERGAIEHLDTIIQDAERNDHGNGRYTALQEQELINSLQYLDDKEGITMADINRAKEMIRIGAGYSSITSAASSQQR